jgi:thiol:disulfide interchange protein
LARLKKLFLIVTVALAASLTLPAHAAAQQTASALFAHAKAEAQQQHKNVLAVFSASWCGPCHLYERFLEDPQMKPITDNAFVVVRIDVGERKGDPKHADTPGGAELRSALGATREPGFPFIVITGENGKPIVNSYRNGNTSDNIGYPVLPQEIDWYIEMLKRAAPQLSAADLSATRAWLQQHAPR